MMWSSIMDSHDVDRFRGLDMSHGFIKSIVKNQIDRDEYHKVMEERKIEVQKKIRESRRKKPAPSAEYKLYVPPHLRGKNDSTETNQKTAPDRRNPCPAIVSEIEEETLREKVTFYDYLPILTLILCLLYFFFNFHPSFNLQRVKNGRGITISPMSKRNFLI
ncbi:unnamed protein product [Cylicostephanus goldi]|uniref:Uncharacterized protein n=1 Tax=Cylicostephanus goldi TaxID=71465 RepID=A0A3P6QQP7_CYLGO|nr:unnamed protein product [Cylicostephanus goldi]